MNSKKFIIKVIWTRAYNPFVFGGSTEQIIGTRITVDPSKDLHFSSRVRIHEVLSPKNTKFYVESRSGGLLGTDLKMIREDLKAAHPTFLKKQLKEQTAAGKRAKIVEPSEFWSRVEH